MPDAAEVIVVHNDTALDRSSVPRDAIHLGSGRNIGFGAAVNLALESVTSARVVLCNPDIVLTREHWDALVTASPDDVVTVPLVDTAGQFTSVTSAYPTPASHLASGYRLGRFAPRGSRTRGMLAQGLGSWGHAHGESLYDPVGSWPLRERWVSGAVLSIDTARLRAIGGFDDRYFLYYEDVDLCRRFSARFPTARAIVADVVPGVHSVGGSAPTDSDAYLEVERIRCESAVQYARAQHGVPWRTCETLLRVRSRGTA